MYWISHYSNSLTSTSTAEWLYRVFISQACVYESQIQYRKSNEILTNVVRGLYTDNVINQQLKEAIETYQVKITGKQCYFAFYSRKTIPMSFDAMTTSPVESVNNHMKHNAGVRVDVMKCVLLFFVTFLKYLSCPSNRCLANTTLASLC